MSELTYSLHVTIRYELEKQLIDGGLQVRDLPGEWNRLYKEYLGVDVPSDREGCLQDSHWSGGSIGYFPSYSLGSAYGAQFLAAMEKEMDVAEAVASGRISEITAWLARRIHTYGSSREPNEILADFGGFDPSYYTDYLSRKYTELYNL